MKAHIFISIFSAHALCHTDPTACPPDAPPVIQPSQAPLALEGGLQLIGVPQEEIKQLMLSHTPSLVLLSKFLDYAKDSNSKEYGSMSLIQRNSLITFAFSLRAADLLSQDDLGSLMTAEKMRTGYPKAHITELQNLCNTLIGNPNYVLPAQAVHIVEEAAPFINQNPFAFVDVLGTIVRLLLKITPGSVPLSTQVQTQLVYATKTVIGLSQEQWQYIQNSIDTYLDQGNIQPSPASVHALIQLMTVAYYPEGTNLPLLFTQAQNLYTIAKMSATTSASFPPLLIQAYTKSIDHNTLLKWYKKTGNSYSIESLPAPAQE